ncbi:hypothetical protein [uncultured Jatrophihabitans sp.]|uniref:hypothetical protein n=1 Tax=uncultured Jatrophihabitans sp. TaxID=1610747 RepID=UPI0035CA847C
MLPDLSTTRRALTDRRVVDPVLRAALVVEASVAAVLDAPTAVRAVLAAAGVLAVLGTAVRRRGRGRLDAAVIGVAGTLAGLVLLGLVLDLFPPGLTRVSWGIGAGVLGLLAVAWGARTTPSGEPAFVVPTSTLLRQGPWVAAAAGVTVVALVIAVHATNLSNRPPVQLSLAEQSAGSVAVHVEAVRDSSPYRIVVTQGATELNRSDPFRLQAGREIAYRFPASDRRVTVELVAVGTSRSTRSLVIDPATARQ